MPPQSNCRHRRHQGFTRLRSIELRRGFTLIEVLVVLGIVGVLATVVIVAVNPRENIRSVWDVRRRQHAREIKNALLQYLIDEKAFPDDASIPTTEAAANPICTQGVTGNPNCLQFDPVVPKYLVELPRDETEPCPDFTGYQAYKKGGSFLEITATHLGKLPGDDDITVLPGCSGGGSSSSAGTSSSALSSSVSSASSSSSAASSALPSAEAVVTDNATGDYAANETNSPRVVFVSDTTGYFFYIDEGYALRYRKTIDGGASWGMEQTVDAGQGWHRVSLWYDSWTPGHAGTTIHIAAMNAGGDLLYTSLDTADDSLRGSFTTVIDAATLAADTSAPSIAAASDGTLFLSAGYYDSFAVERSTDGGNTWTNTAVSFAGGLARQDRSQVLPLSGDDMLLILQDTSQTDLRSKEYDAATEGWTNEQTFDTDWGATFFDRATWSASLAPTTNDVYFAGHSDPQTATADTRAYRFSDVTRTWSALTDVNTDNADIVQSVMLVDGNTGHLYAAYALGTATTQHAYYKVSTDSGVSWSPPTQMSTTPGNHVMIHGNLTSSERLYPVWLFGTTHDYIGYPIDLAP